ncbi:MAG TPA: septal ring lytic transglycosylase RlpA family protein [Usitatibacter sp.]|nr:septal ring lytic transglycosylase RlpA family protein [Usitatibacter sp.]
MCPQINADNILPILAVALFISGCGTAPKKAEAPTATPGTFGKYYSDDGPPEKVPDNLAQIPDAVPRDEPFHRFANRPYTVFGQTYVPVVDKEPTKQRGMASWYGRKFHGQKTSSGEIYDMFAMTAAHKTFPLPSYARVTNVKTGQSVVVRVNDRGPFHSNRIIDLSYAAAARIGIVSAGSGMVEVERIIPGVGVSDELAAAAVPPPIMATVKTPVLTQEGSSLWLQLGAFSSVESAESFRDHVARELSWLLEPVGIASHDGLHRVRLGPYRNPEEASAIGDKVRRSLGIAPALVR